MEANNNVVDIFSDEKKPKSLINPKTIVIGSVAGAAFLATIAGVGYMLSQKDKDTPPAPQHGTGGNNHQVDASKNGIKGLEGDGDNSQRNLEEGDGVSDANKSSSGVPLQKSHNGERNIEWEEQKQALEAEHKQREIELQRQEAERKRQEEKAKEEREEEERLQREAQQKQREEAERTQRETEQRQQEAARKQREEPERVKKETEKRDIEGKQQKELECTSLCEQIKGGIDDLFSNPSEDKANKLKALHSEFQTKCNGVNSVDSDILSKSLAEIADPIFEEALTDAQNANHSFDDVASELQKKLDGLRYLNPNCKYNNTADQMLCDHHFALLNEKILSRDLDAAGKDFSKSRSYCKEDNTKPELKDCILFDQYFSSWIKTSISRATTEDSALNKLATDLLEIKNGFHGLSPYYSFNRVKDEAFTNFVVTFKGSVPKFNAKLKTILDSENLTQSTFDEFKAVYTTLASTLPLDNVFLDTMNEEEKNVSKIIEGIKKNDLPNNNEFDKWIGDQLFEVLSAKLDKVYKDGSDLTKITNLMSSMKVGCKSASEFTGRFQVPEEIVKALKERYEQEIQTAKNSD